MKTFIARHGDVLIIQVAELPVTATKAEKQSDGQIGVVLEYGEVTGHAHRIKSGTVVLWNADQQRYITVARESTLTHEEHGSIVLPPGVYEVRRQRVYTPEGIRHVLD